MSFGWAGAAAGANEGLQEYLTRKLHEAQLLQQAQAQQDAAQRANRSIALQEQEASDRHAERMRPVAPPPAHRTVIETVGPDGKPIQKSMTDEELSAGVPKYVAPPVVKEPTRRVIQTIGPKGQPIQKAMTDEELSQGVPSYVAPQRPETETQGLRNDMLRIQMQQAEDKLEAGRKAQADQQAAVGNGRADVRDLAQSLLDDPALEGITGAIEGRRDTFFQGSAVDAKRRLDQLVGKLSLESRGKMKGQGQISDFEGRLLQNAVSAIDRAAGPEVVKKHLQEIVDAFSGDAPQSGPAAPAAGGSSFRVIGVR